MGSTCNNCLGNYNHKSTCLFCTSAISETDHVREGGGPVACVFTKMYPCSVFAEVVPPWLCLCQGVENRVDFGCPQLYSSNLQKAIWMGAWARASTRVSSSWWKLEGITCCCTSTQKILGTPRLCNKLFCLNRIDTSVIRAHYTYMHANYGVFNITNALAWLVTCEKARSPIADPWHPGSRLHWQTILEFVTTLAVQFDILLSKYGQNFVGLGCRDYPN